MVSLSDAVQARLRYWEEQLADAALNNDLARTQLCGQFIQEYTDLVEMSLAGVSDRPRQAVRT
jgi:hypothetical protein